MAQLGHGLGFDLPDALSGDPVGSADLIKRAWLAIGKPKSQTDDAGFPFRQRGQH